MIFAVLLALTPTAYAESAATNSDQRCSEAHAYLDVGPAAADFRWGRVNVKQYWCWDGGKITHAPPPQVTTTKTKAGKFVLKWNVPKTAQISEQDPQNGGYFTRKILVTGTAEGCVFKYGCVQEHDIGMVLFVFGDGGKFQEVL